MTEFPVSQTTLTRSGRESYCYDSKVHPGVTYTFIVKDTTRKKLKLCCAACTKVKRKIPSLKAPIIYMANETTFDRDPDGLNHLCTLGPAELRERAQEAVMVEDGDTPPSTSIPTAEGFPVSRVTLAGGKGEAYCYDSRTHPGVTYVFTVKDVSGRGAELVCSACLKMKKSIPSAKVPNLHLLSDFVFDRDPDGLSHLCTREADRAQDVPDTEDLKVEGDSTGESIFDVIEKLASGGESSAEASSTYATEAPHNPSVYPVSRIEMTRSNRKNYQYDSRVHEAVTYVFTVKEHKQSKLKLECSGCKRAKRTIRNGRIPIIYSDESTFDRDPDAINHICVALLANTSALSQAQALVDAVLGNLQGEEPRTYPVSRVQEIQGKNSIYYYDSRTRPDVTFVFRVKQKRKNSIMLDCRGCRKAKTNIGGRIPVLNLVGDEFDRDPDKLEHICLIPGAIRPDRPKRPPAAPVPVRKPPLVPFPVSRVEQTSRLANAYVYESLRHPGKSFTFHVKENMGWKLKLNCAGCKNRVVRTEDGKVPVLYLVDDMFDRDPDELNHVCVQELDEPEYVPVVEECPVGACPSRKKSCKRVYKYESKVHPDLVFCFEVKEVLIDGRMRLDCSGCRAVKASRGGRLPIISLVDGKFDKDPDKLVHICLPEHLRTTQTSATTSHVESGDRDDEDKAKDESGEIDASELLDMIFRQFSDTPAA